MRVGVSFAYDPVRAVLVMTGGSEETWTFNGTWAEVTTARLTPSPSVPLMAWDAARQRVVMTIGHQAGRPFSETREFDGTSWVLLPSSTPSAYVEEMAYDSGRNRVVLVGTPTSGGLDMQSWELGVFRSQPSSQYVQSTLVASCAALTSPVILLGSSTSPAIDDETTSATVPLPFQFWHFGVPVTHLSVQTNGLMQLHTSASGVGMASTFLDIGTPLPATSGPNGFIAPLWVDLEPLQTGRVHAQTFGAPGFRVHVIEWRDLVRFGTTIGVNFQVKLFEDSGAVEVHWCTVPPLSQIPVVALENLTGTAVSQFTGPATTAAGVRFQP